MLWSRVDRRACPPKRRAGKEASRVGGSNSVVESQPSKLLVAGSIPVSRSRLRSLAFAYELRLGRPASEVCLAEAAQRRRRTTGGLRAAKHTRALSAHACQTNA